MGNAKACGTTDEAAVNEPIKERKCLWDQDLADMWCAVMNRRTFLKTLGVLSALPVAAGLGLRGRFAEAKVIIREGRVKYLGGGFYSIDLTAEEMSAARVEIHVQDSAWPADWWEKEVIVTKVDERKR